MLCSHSRKIFALFFGKKMGEEVMEGSGMKYFQLSLNFLCLVRTPFRTKLQVGTNCNFDDLPVPAVGKKFNIITPKNMDKFTLCFTA